MSICVYRVALVSAEMPHPNRVQRYAEALGLELAFERSDDSVFTYTLDGHDVLAALGADTFPTPHSGPTSITRDEQQRATHSILITAPTLDAPMAERDTLMARITAAFVDASTCAMGVEAEHGWIVHKARLFADLARVASDEGTLLSSLVLADIASATEMSDHRRMALFTHNLPRYGAEDICISCPRDDVEAALHDLCKLADRRIAQPALDVRDGELIGRATLQRVDMGGMKVWYLQR